MAGSAKRKKRLENMTLKELLAESKRVREVSNKLVRRYQDLSRQMDDAKRKHK